MIIVAVFFELGNDKRHLNVQCFGSESFCLDPVWTFFLISDRQKIRIRSGKSESRSETYEYRTVKLYNKQPPFASLTVNLYRFNRCG